MKPARSHLMHVRVCGTMGIRLTSLVVASLLASSASAQSASQPRATTTPVGTWRGTSTCLVRPSACHDEIILYRIAKTKVADSVTIDGRRITRGEEQEMGVLTCQFTSPNGLVTCAIPQGTWQFRVHNDSLVGELRHPDNTKFRDVRAVRAR